MKTTNSSTQKLVAVGAIAAIAVLVVAGLASRDADRTTTPEGGPPCFGTEVSLAAARNSATFDLLEPDAPLANPNRLKAVWKCGSPAGGYLLLYDSGVEVVESVNDLKDPAAEWQGLADDYEEFSTGDINGIPASFADPTINDAIGGVDFVVGEVRYTVSGNGEIPLSDLVLVASSLPVKASASPDPAA